MNYLDFNGALDAQTDNDYEEYQGLRDTIPLWARRDIVEE